MSTIRRASPRVTAAVVTVVVVQVGAVVGLLVADRVLAGRGRADLVGLQGETWIFLVAILSSLTTGAVVAWSRPANPVGWLFLGLSGAMLLSGVVDEYLAFAISLEENPTATARFGAVLGSSSFIPWLVLVAVILHLTPTGRTLPGRWSVLPRLAVVCGTLAWLTSLVSTSRLEAPYDDVANPRALPEVARVTDPLELALLLVVAACLVAGAVSIFVRFRRSSGDERRQLLWLVLVAAPLPLFVVGAFAAAFTGHQMVTVLMTDGFVVLVPVAAGLSVLRFQLYNVERVVSRVVSYALLTTALLAVYLLVVLLASRLSGALAVSPVVSATLGAVTAAVVAAPLRQSLQAEVDRRFNRRRFRAETVVRRALAELDPGSDLERLLREALDDPGLSIVHPGEVAGTWVDAAGHSATQDGDHVDVERGGRVVARVHFDSRVSDPQTVRSVATLAAAELDNVRLRAELSRRVNDVTDSRRRIAAAQREERRRIERDLHDGAQQSLLALALDLQAAHLAPDEEKWKDALGRGVKSARSAVHQLRDLANGLHPAALADGGLRMALADLAERSHMSVRLDVDVPRLPPALEFTAWLVASEALVNAQKHAEADTVELAAEVVDGHLVLRVSDDGRGGARPEGSGLSGLRDRVEAAGGHFGLASDDRGTTVEVHIPCAP